MRLGEPTAAPRISDLGALIPSTTGKIELETLNDEAPEERVVERAHDAGPGQRLRARVNIDELDQVISAFENGLVLETGERIRSREYVRWSRETPGLAGAVARLGGGDSPAAVARASSSCWRACTSTGG